MNKTDSPNYDRWYAMMQRCYNTQDPAYHRYGGRGIRVCSRWHDLQNYDADIGVPPSSEHTLDRINVDGNYEPGNCAWATPQEQARNRTNNVLHEYEGKQYFLQDLAAEKGISYRTLDDRMRRKGMSLEQALTAPIQNFDLVEVEGVRMTKADAARSAGIAPNVFYARLNRGMSLEEALKKPNVRGRPRKKL